MRKRWWVPTIAVAVGLLAFLIRFLLMYRSGLSALGAYDDGVYFGGALSLAHGLLPYKDFLLLHPPGVLLASLPFAWLAPLIGDAHAFVLARIAFIAVGGANAALIALVLKRWGWGAMLVGGVAYAFSFPAVYGERSVLLEPLGTTAVLLAVLCLQRARKRFGLQRWYWAAGVFVGLSCVFKIWYAPIVVLLVVFAWRNFWRVLIGAVVAPTVVLLPFFIAAPKQMFTDVVLAQLGRPKDASYNLGDRLYRILGVKGAVRTPDHSNLAIPGVDPHLVLAVLLLLGLAAGVVCLFVKSARILVALAALTGGILLLSPSFFQHYAVLTAMPLALVAGAGVGVLSGWVRGKRRLWLRIVVAAGACLVAVGLGVHLDAGYTGQKVSAQMHQALVAVKGCIATDDPTILIVSDTYSRNLDRGCTTQVDASGYGYVVPKAGTNLSRSKNPAFQREAMAYLRGADAFIFTRHGSYGLDKQNTRLTNAAPVVFTDGTLTLHGRLP